MIEPHKSKLLTNLKKTRGLIDAIERMVQDDRYCMDIAQQINASLGLMKSAKDLILESHLSSCASHIGIMPTKRTRSILRQMGVVMMIIMWKVGIIRSLGAGE